MSLVDYLNSAIDLVYPRICFSCDESIKEEMEIYICGKCRKKINLRHQDRCFRCATAIGLFSVVSKRGCVMCENMKLYFDGVYSVMSYEGVIRNLLHKFKYGKSESLLVPLGNILVENVKNCDFLRDIDVVIPVPLFWKQQIKRGFNQSEMFARRLSAHLSINISHRNLVRVRNTETQTHLSHDERIYNVTGAFSVRKRQKIAGKKILLIDDVMTTGVTASECSSVLKKSGADSVYVITLARVDNQ